MPLTIAGQYLAQAQNVSSEDSAQEPPLKRQKIVSIEPESTPTPLVEAKAKGKKEEDPIETLHDQGLEALHRDDIPAAQSYFEQAIALLDEAEYPVHENARAGAYSNLGSVLILQGKLTEAKDYLEKACNAYKLHTQDPVNVGYFNSIMFNLGSCCLDLGQYQEAIIWLEAAYKNRLASLGKDNEHTKIAKTLLNRAKGIR